MRRDLSHAPIFYLRALFQVQWRNGVLAMKTSIKITEIIMLRTCRDGQTEPLAQ